MKPRPLSSKSRKQYWGVLAWDPDFKTFRKSDNFMRLQQVQYQKSGAVGRHKDGRLSGKTSL